MNKPNEELTIQQLKDMEGKPVWCEQGDKYCEYGLVNVKGHEISTLRDCLDFGILEEDGWKIYASATTKMPTANGQRDIKKTKLERELLIAYESLMAQKKELKKAVKSLVSKPGTTVWIGTAKSFAEYQRVCGAILLTEQVLHIKPVDLTEEADENQSC